MEKEKLFIYDETFFKKVTYQKLKNMKGGRNLILHDIFKDICENKEKYNMGKQAIATLIKSGKLIVESMPTVYEKVAIRDKIICLALIKGEEYDVTVYTKDQKLALDLVLNGIKAKNVDCSKKFVNIGKSQEKGDIYIYDTCTLITNMEKIDFSKNIHYFSTCVLEELFKDSSDNGTFFKFLHVFNEYPEHVKILNTASSTQKGGRYSYTDLLILYSSIRSKNEFRDKNITLVTDDRQLYFEAMYLNLFNVTNKFNYFDVKSYVEEDSANDEVLEQEEIQEESYECHESATTLLSELVEDAILDAITEEDIESDESETFLEQEEENAERTMSLEEKVVEVTNNYKVLPLKKLHRKNVVNLPEIIERVYSPKFLLITPVLRRKLEKDFTAETFILKVGYYITFKNNPTVSYKVVGINNLIATLERI